MRKTKKECENQRTFSLSRQFGFEPNNARKVTKSNKTSTNTFQPENPHKQNYKIYAKNKFERGEETEKKKNWWNCRNYRTKRREKVMEQRLVKITLFNT